MYVVVSRVLKYSPLGIPLGQVCAKEQQQTSWPFPCTLFPTHPLSTNPFIYLKKNPR